MWKSIYLIQLFLVLGYLQSQCQSLGFEQTECGIVTNPAYSFKNFLVPIHGRGYLLFHNGDTIAGDSSNFFAPEALELRFIDYLTGYFVVENYDMYGFYISSFSIYRISDDSVTFIGNVPREDYEFYENYGFYIVSRHTLYFSSTGFFYNPPLVKKLFISRLSDILPQKNIVNGDTTYSDTTVFDTIAGIPSCSGQNELNYRYKNLNDTAIYTILFNADTLVNIRNKKNSLIKVFPNPANEYVRFDAMDHGCPVTVYIRDISGILIKSIVIPPPVSTKIFIGDFTKGVYFIEINIGETKEFHKLIKI